MWEQLPENETAVRSGKPNDTASLTVLVGEVKCVERLSLAPGVVSGHAGGAHASLLEGCDGAPQPEALPGEVRLLTEHHGDHGCSRCRCGWSLPVCAGANDHKQS